MARESFPQSFGRPLRSQFGFDAQWTNLNQGSFGSTPREVQKALRNYQDEAESSPDLFYRYKSAGLILRSRRCAAELLKAPVQSVVIVQNATVGINTALDNVPFSSGDHVILFSTTYGACERIVYALSHRRGFTVHKVTVATADLEQDRLLESFKQGITCVREAGGNPQLALFDTVSSLPALRFPFEALIALCRSEGILSCVDGAHGIGLMDLNLGELDPDFFVSNAHKWLFVPRSCAVFYVSQRQQHLIRTTIPISWGYVIDPANQSSAFKPALDGYELTAFETLFNYTGTIDISSYCCVLNAIEWRKQRCGGEKNIIQYCNSLAAQGANAVANTLGTEILGEITSSVNQDIPMRNVRLPLDVKGAELSVTDLVAAVHRHLVEEHRTFVSCFHFDGSLWVRLCAQVYLDLADFEYLGKALLATCENVRQLTS